MSHLEPTAGEPISVRLTGLGPLLAFGLIQVLEADPRFRVAGAEDPAHVVVSGLPPAAAKFAAPTLIIAHPVERPEVEKCLEAGGCGFVPEDAPPDTVLAAIRQVAAGGRFTTDPAPEPGRPLPDALSPRERQVLTWIAQGRTHYQVARILGISAHTVDTYVKRAKSKLSLGNKADLTRAVLSHHTH